MSAMDSFVAVTTPAKTKRHWALPRHAPWGYFLLCNTSPRVFDQIQLDDAMPPGWRKRTVIVDLPSCKQCDKARQRRMDGRPS